MALSAYETMFAMHACKISEEMGPFLWESKWGRPCDSGVTIARRLASVQTLFHWRLPAAPLGGSMLEFSGEGANFCNNLQFSAKICVLGPV